MKNPSTSIHPNRCFLGPPTLHPDTMVGIGSVIIPPAGKTSELQSLAHKNSIFSASHLSGLTSVGSVETPPKNYASDGNKWGRSTHFLGWVYIFSILKFRNHNSKGRKLQDPGQWPTVAAAARKANLFRYRHLPYLFR